MTLSFSSFSALPALVACAAAWAGPEPVTLPVVAFSGARSQTLEATLWKATAKVPAARFRGVLLVPPEPGSERTFTGLAEELSSKGFDAVVLKPRVGKKLPQRALIEDIQSGVHFMKTDKRVGSVKVLVVGAGPSANAAAVYAAASPQMMLILDGVVLLSPSPVERDIKLADSLRSVRKVPVLLISKEKAVLGTAGFCPQTCRTLTSSDGPRAIVATKEITSFLLKPHG